MIDATELRKKYFKNEKFEDTLNYIEKEIEHNAQNKEGFVIVQIPSDYRDRIETYLEEKNYAVWTTPIQLQPTRPTIGKEYITICWDEVLIYRQNELDNFADMLGRWM